MSLKTLGKNRLTHFKIKIVSTEDTRRKIEILPKGSVC